MRIRARDECRWDFVTLGEVLLRLDPGQGSLATARTFQAWSAGAEHNVAVALTRCFGLRTALVTALVDNDIGRLLEGRVRDAGVDVSHVRWREFDGVGRVTRNGLYFAERGATVERGRACYDRGHTAVSQLKAGDIDWDRIFGAEGARWFHTGGVFCALSASAPEVAREAMQAARAHGAIVSYDVNYREALWRAHGGKARSDAMTRELAPLADVLLGVDDAARDFPGRPVVATTRRANGREWGALCRAEDALYAAERRGDLPIVDRVGAGDAFAAGLIYGLLAGRGAQYAVDCGAALGALTMTTPGDTAVATRAQVEALMPGARAEAVP